MENSLISHDDNFIITQIIVLNADREAQRKLLKCVCVIPQNIAGIFHYLKQYIEQNSTIYYPTKGLARSFEFC